MSAGTRSGVNCTRENVPPTTLARVSTASALATPGTPSSRQWPRASRATNIPSTIRSWPTMTRLTSNIARSSCDASCAGGTGAAPDVVSVSGVVGWATGPPQRSTITYAGSMPTLKTYTTLLGESWRSANTPLHRCSPWSAGVDLSARYAGTGTGGGRMRAAANRVTFLSSPGDFPRGRPALHFLPLLPPGTVVGMVEELAPQCSAKGCRAPAAWQLRWNNPKLHTPQHRKTWLACDDHRESLSTFLDLRGFLRGVAPFGAAAD